MSDEFRIDDELNAVESALSGLKPRASTVDRDRLLYLDGQSSPVATPSSSRRWLWPAATVLSTSAAALFAVLYFTTDQTVAAPKVRIVYVAPPTVPTNTPVVIKKREPQHRMDRGFVAEIPPADAGHFRTESKMLRSRHPILTTDLERLPLAASGGSTNRKSPQSLHEMRVSLAAEWKSEPDQPTKKTSGLRLFQWAWPSQQGDRL